MDSLDHLQKVARDLQCNDCGAMIVVRFRPAPPPDWGQGEYYLSCGRDSNHEGTTTKRHTRTIQGRTFDVTTQTEIMPYPKSEQAMVSRFQESMDIGLFPSGKGDNKISSQQLMNLAKIAMLYHLDPLMKEIMPYQGQPYITIEGRRRIDARAGNYPSFRIPKPMDRETYQRLVEMEAINDGDIVLVGEMTNTKNGQTIEVTGRVLVTEKGQNEHLPITKWRYEMALKRWEYRGRRELFGPVALPGGMDAQVRLFEEEDYIEAEVREVDYDTGEIMDATQEETRAETAPDDGADLFPEDVPPENEAVPPEFKAVVDRAGAEGLTLVDFCEKVLPKNIHTIAAFVEKGGKPDLAETYLDSYLKKQGGQ